MSDLTLDQLDRFTRDVDEFVRRAAPHFTQAEVTAQVARSRNLTPDHAAGVVARRWPTLSRCPGCGCQFALRPDTGDLNHFRCDECAEPPPWLNSRLTFDGEPSYSHHET